MDELQSSTPAQVTSGISAHRSPIPSPACSSNLRRQSRASEFWIWPPARGASRGRWRRWSERRAGSWHSTRNAAMLAVGRAMPGPAGATIEWLEGNAVSVNLPDAAFDLVLCQQGLQFFADRVAALREMQRVLVPDGRVGISVWQTVARHPVYEALCKATARHLGVPMSVVDVPFLLGGPDELRALLRDGGFPSHRHHAAIARRQSAAAGAVGAAHGARGGDLGSRFRPAGCASAVGARGGGVGRDRARERGIQEGQRADLSHAHQHRDRVLIVRWSGYWRTGHERAVHVAARR